MDRFFDPKRALAGDPVLTVDGREVIKVVEIRSDAHMSSNHVDWCGDELPILGLSVTILNGDRQDTYPYYHNGGSHKYGLPSTADLTMVDIGIRLRSSSIYQSGDDMNIPEHVHVNTSAEDLLELVQVLDRRLVQLWDKVSFERANSLVEYDRLSD